MDFEEMNEMTFEEVTKRTETSEEKDFQGTVRLYKGKTDIKVALILSLKKSFVVDLKGWDKGMSVGLAIGNGAWNNKIMVSVPGAKPIAKIIKPGLGGLTINFGHIEKFGFISRPPKGVKVTKINESQIMVDMPTWRDDEVAVPKVRKNVAKEPVKRIDPLRPNMGITGVKPNPAMPLVATQSLTISDKGQLLSTHEIGIRVYKTTFEFREKVIPISQTQAAILGVLTKYFDQFVSASRCIDLGFRMIDEVPSDMSYALVPTQMAEILPRLKSIGVVVTVQKPGGFKLSLA